MEEEIKIYYILNGKEVTKKDFDLFQFHKQIILGETRHLEYKEDGKYFMKTSEEHYQTELLREFLLRDESRTI